MRSLPVHVAVALSGAAVLAIGILGTRVIGSFYGGGLYPWSVLLSVVLAGLGLGHALGGRRADRGLRPTDLALFLGPAGVWILITPGMAGWLLNPAGHLDLRLAVFLGAALLYLPPLTLLGMVFPCAIRLEVRAVEGLGRTTGDIFALSAVSGMVGALLTGFVLVPRLGVGRLTLLISGALLAGAAFIWLSERKSRPAGVILLVFLVPGTLALWKPVAEQSDPASGLTAIRQSQSGEVRVEEIGDTRALVIDGLIRGRIEPGVWKSTLACVVTIDLVKHILRQPGRALVLGLGVGSVARSFAQDGWSVDAVEPDSTVVGLARRYFGFKPGEARVFVMDPRAYLATHAGRYDLVVLDTYGGDPVPFRMVTREALDLAASHLNPQGVLVVNAVTSGWEDPLLKSLAATLRLRFTQVTALPTTEPPNAAGNIVLLAGNRPLDFPGDEIGNPFEFLPDPYQHWAVVQGNHAWDNRYSPGVEGARVLTDDFNPGDLWAEAANYGLRKAMRDNPSGQELGW